MGYGAENIAGFRSYFAQTCSRASALARLCEREGLDASEIAGVLCVALTWAPGLPRDPTALLRSFSMAA